MQMKLTLEELINIILAKSENTEIMLDTLKTKVNILARVLYKKGLITEEEIKESVKEEYKILQELGMIPPNITIKDIEQQAESLTKGIVNWLKGDVTSLKEAIKEQERKLKELLSQETSKPKIDVAPAEVLNHLDKITGKGGKKLIL